ncbi:MAG TPA: hypothetical protein PKH89_03980, partial [Anaerolineae bacterium]|nr:hypothetical protein [Anaerolineae bacterium]
NLEDHAAETAAKLRLLFPVIWLFRPAIRAWLLSRSPCWQRARSARIGTRKRFSRTAAARRGD